MILCSLSFNTFKLSAKTAGNDIIKLVNKKLHECLGRVQTQSLLGRTMSPFQAKCSLSAPPENIKKSKVF